MSERDHYPAGVPCWVDTLKPDPEAASSFYGELFGWQFAGPGPMPGDPPWRYYVARLRGRDVAGISSMPAQGAPPAAVWNTYIAVENADAAATSARRAGGTVALEPFDVPPAGRMALLTDPAGASFCIWEAKQRPGAQLVNEPGAWAMSLLQTSDPEGAQAFYGRVFGWRAEPLPVDGVQVLLWRLPGYVGGEPQQPVPRDVVGVMATRAPDAGPDAPPPSCSVDFWIADADAAAATAVQRGGQAIVEPHDTAGFRRAILADPAGAAFSVSTLILPPH